MVENDRTTEAERTDAAYVEITNDEEAERALRKILAAREERDRLQKLVDAERTRLDTKEARIEESYEKETACLMDALHRYANSVQCRQTKTTRQYALLSGRLAGRLVVKKARQVIDHTDTDAVTAWCEKNAPGYVEWEPKLRWGDLKKVLAIEGDTVVYQPTGETVDALTVTTVSETFDVQ